MTTVKSEQRVLNLETTSGAVKLNSEARLNASGDILNINGQIQAGDTHVGSFNVYESPDAKLSTNINVTDLVNLSDASAAVKLLISDIEAMKVV